MGQSVVDTSVQGSAYESPVQAHREERRLRQAGAWIILYLLLQAQLGLAWDREWHDLVGRDQFWIPPHIMMYSGLGGVGIVALVLILADTIRYRRRKPGVDDGSTVHIFWMFHAPLGFLMVGFGAFTDLLAAPFDNYWHQLYGIDVTLWSPFHLMGSIGGVLAGLGSVYIFASEASIERQTPGSHDHFLGLKGSEWGVVILLAAFIELTLPSLTAFIPVPIGSVQLLTYPLILTIAVCGSLFGVVQTIRKPGIASLTISILCVEALFTQLFVPLALDYIVPRFGYTFRFAGRDPSFNITLVILPLVFFLSAFLVDGVSYWRRLRKGTENYPLRRVMIIGMLMTLPLLVFPSLIVQMLLQGTHASVPPDVSHVLGPNWLATLVTLPVTLLLGAIIAMLGSSLGDIWHLSRQ
ncbi:MAG TPA: hypothetical protein VEU97_10680 [Ktedonobacteraceae bacterium]|nr:hypothetical protein [Ktedonobacteraceae bacterium]